MHGTALPERRWQAGNSNQSALLESLNPARKAHNLEFLTQVQSWINSIPFLKTVLQVTGVVFLSWVLFMITQNYLLHFLRKIVARSKSELDDILIEKVFARRLAFAVPLMVFYYFANIFPQYQADIQRALFAAIILIIILAIGAFLNILPGILGEFSPLRDKPVKSYIQVVQIILYVLGAITVFGLLIGSSPLGLISSLGAMTAVLILVFRDTILSFIASLQIASYDLVRVGDWIEVKSFGADGDVIDIALHTIKIQNWDKTITVIPTHKLIDATYKNWRGMSESGGRRIKRSVHIDISTIGFCDEQMLEKFCKIKILRDYIEEKTATLEQYNKEQDIDSSVVVNGRRMTNIGTFRAYVEAYLRNHPAVHDNMTCMVRQRPPGPQGLPIEIYVFSNDIAWAKYEAIQADIFDHILAVIPEFGLKVFQEPAGHDLQNLNSGNR